jgi:hypothetical protein
MPYWQNITSKLSNPNNNNHILITAHLTTKHKLEAARLHLSILNSTTDLPFIDSIKFLKRSMVENILFDLASSLDSLAHEINQIYSFGIGINKIQIDHFRSQPTKERNCLRCKLDDISKDELPAYLNSELPREPIPQNHWYYVFGRYRQQITHRPWLMILLVAEGTFLPDDPTVSDPIVKPYYDHKSHQITYPNYQENREVRTYCNSCLAKYIYGVYLQNFQTGLSIFKLTVEVSSVIDRTAKTIGNHRRDHRVKYPLFLNFLHHSLLPSLNQ